MTVTYTGTVSNASIKSFMSALLLWRGSVWKSVWKELVLWCICYAILSAAYRCLMNQEQQYLFEDVCALFYKYSEMLPITFLLGFFVQQVVARWGRMFSNLGFCDNYSLAISAYVIGDDERARMIRRTLSRYLSLLQILVYREISVRIRRRFPTLDSLVTAGVLKENEKSALESARAPHAHLYLPTMWAMQVVRRAKEENFIRSDFAVSDLYKHFLEYWQNEFNLTCYDWVPLPLVYTQVVFLSVRVYFIINLLGRQYIMSDRYDELRGPLDAYVPFFTIFQFIFYMGWLKVAEALLNPFGDDDDDFEVNWVVDRNMSVSMKIVDYEEGGEGHAVLTKDSWWSESAPVPMYSAAAAMDRVVEPEGSAVAATATPKNVVMVPRPSMCVGADQECRRRSIFVGPQNALRSLISSTSSQVNGDVETRRESRAPTPRKSQTELHISSNNGL